MRDHNVPHFGVEKSVYEFAIDHCATADAGTDCQIDEGVESLCCAPGPFTERRAVDIRIEADGNFKG
jgi:hypothetical protein